MKNSLLPLIVLFFFANCSTNSTDKKKIEKNPQAPSEGSIKSDSGSILFDSLKIETPLFFNDPSRNLKDFTITSNYPPFDKIIKDLENNKNAWTSITPEYNWGDCSGSYKVLTDTLTKSTLYLFKTDCYEYNFSNDQYLFVNDTLAMIRQYSCGLYDFRTDSTSPSITMTEKLFILNANPAVIKERRKRIRGDKNYTLNDIAFKDSIVSREELLKQKTEEFKYKIDFITRIITGERIRAEEHRLELEKQKEIIDNLTPEQLFTTSESRRKAVEKLLAGKGVKEKRYFLMAGSKNSITVYYQYKRIVMVLYNAVNSSSQVDEINAFYFDESNNCISNTRWSSKDKISITYDMHWGSLIKYDINSQRIEMDSLQKQQIIETSRSTLASMMKHFPGFRYTFEWR